MGNWISHGRHTTLPNNKEMMEAVFKWIERLDDYPGWKKWNTQRFSRTLLDDDWLTEEEREPQGDFTFSDDMERQYDVAFQYLGLHQTVHVLSDCEFYFRRFPFHGLPISYSDHITNICEMYFGRFYEFRERLKNYLNALARALPSHRIEIGRFIKSFDKEFDSELRARNSVHHHQRFKDQAIDRVFLAHALSKTPSGLSWKKERERAYRKLTREWVVRVRNRAAKVEEFLDATSTFALANCSFLSFDANAPASTAANQAGAPGEKA